MKWNVADICSVNLEGFSIIARRLFRSFSDAILCVSSSTRVFEL